MQASALADERGNVAIPRFSASPFTPIAVGQSLHQVQTTGEPCHALLPMLEFTLAPQLQTYAPPSPAESTGPHAVPRGADYNAIMVIQSWLLLLLLSCEAHPCVVAQSTGPAPMGAPVPHLLSGALLHQPAASSNSSSSDVWMSSASTVLYKLLLLLVAACA
jgi:hypothetical protein